MTVLGSPICILGMHRSGTSVLTRILNILGVYLGPDSQLLEPSASNPKGYWEHKEFVKINDEILNRFGGNWHTAPEFVEGWESAPELDDLEELARKILAEEFATVELWGWKDPRTCLTLAFWQRVFGPLRYIISLRNPIDVASSLKVRNAFSTEQGVCLWLVHVQRALAQIKNEPRLLVFYEDLLNDSQREIERISAFIGKPELAASLEVRKLVEDSIHKELRHHHTPVDCDGMALNSTTVVEMAQLIYARIKCGDWGEVDQMLATALNSQT